MCMCSRCGKLQGRYVICDSNGRPVPLFSAARESCYAIYCEECKNIVQDRNSSMSLLAITTIDIHGQRGKP